MNVRYLGRYNRCEMSGRCEDTGFTFRRDGSIYPCFHAAFCFVDRNGRFKSEVNYRLFMKQRCDGVNNNFMILEKPKIVRLLKVFKEVIPFHYKFVEGEEPGFTILELNLVGTRTQHKGLLMLSRMLFEYPHNMCAYDALKLRDMHFDDFNIKQFSLISLYMMCISTTDFSHDECLIQHNHPKLMRVKDLKSAFGNPARKKVSAIVTRKEFINRDINEPRTLEEIYSDEGFNKRSEIYLQNLRNYLSA